MEEVGLGREGTWETGRLSPASACYCITLLCKAKRRRVEFRAPPGRRGGVERRGEGRGWRGGKAAGPFSSRRAPQGSGPPQQPEEVSGHGEATCEKSRRPWLAGG